MKIFFNDNKRMFAYHIYKMDRILLITKRTTSIILNKIYIYKTMFILWNVVQL